MSAATFILVLALSLLIVLSLSVLGGGGSILTVPIQVYIAGFNSKEAIAASLFAVGTTSRVSALGHARAHRVRWHNGLIFRAAGMVGAFLAGYLSTVQIDWSVTLTVTTLAIVGSLVDAKLAGQIPEARLRASFGWLVLLMGVFLLVQDVPRAFVLPAILAAMVLATLVAAGQRKRKLRETTQFPATVPEE